MSGVSGRHRARLPGRDETGIRPVAIVVVGGGDFGRIPLRAPRARRGAGLVIGEFVVVDFDLIDDTSRLGRRGRSAWIAEAMQRHCADLAWRVQRHPLQWFNFFPFWLDCDDAHSDAGSEDGRPVG